MHSICECGHDYEEHILLPGHPLAFLTGLVRQIAIDERDTADTYAQVENHIDTIYQQLSKE